MRGESSGTPSDKSPPDVIEKFEGHTDDWAQRCQRPSVEPWNG